MSGASRGAGVTEVLVLGAGVVGLTCALRLAQTGWSVTVVSEPGGGASAAAAGMLAPASEAVLDEVSEATAGLWRRAARAWPKLAAQAGIVLDLSGSVHLGAIETLERRRAAARRLGFDARLEAAGEVHRTHRAARALVLPEDMLLEPGPALLRLRAAAEQAGVRFEPGRITVEEGDLRIDGAGREADLIVVALGWEAAKLAGFAPELAVLSPIKGRLLRFPKAPPPGPVIRAPGAYLAPQPRGWLAGATMEVGRGDLEPEPETLLHLHAAASAVLPELADTPFETAVGVRASTPDGAPLVGFSRTPGVILAAGLRRNGWLLAPLVAETVAAYAEGRDPDVIGVQARAWSPARVPSTAPRDPPA